MGRGGVGAEDLLNKALGAAAAGAAKGFADAYGSSAPNVSKYAGTVFGAAAAIAGKVGGAAAIAAAGAGALGPLVAVVTVPLAVAAAVFSIAANIETTKWNEENAARLAVCNGLLRNAMDAGGSWWTWWDQVVQDARDGFPGHGVKCARVASTIRYTDEAGAERTMPTAVWLRLVGDNRGGAAAVLAACEDIAPRGGPGGWAGAMPWLLHWRSVAVWFAAQPECRAEWKAAIDPLGSMSAAERLAEAQSGLGGEDAANSARADVVDDRAGVSGRWSESAATVPNRAKGTA